jgi:DNA polymerase III subunit delta'
MTPLAPWLQSQLAELVARSEHALLLEAPSGSGQDELALALAHAWLCHTPLEQRAHGAACGECASCQLLAAHTHPDFQRLMPETEALAQGFPLDEKAQSEIDAKKRKPSREIRVEAMHAMIEFAQRTASLKGGKAVLIRPAQAMNQVSANALLKTLEEPPAGLRFALASTGAARMLPTVRSRCSPVRVRPPHADQAVAWLQEQGLASEAAAVWWAASGQRAQLALNWGMTDGKPTDPASWTRLVQSMRQGDATALAAYSNEPPRWIDALQKIAHDALAVAQGAAPRYFPEQTLEPLKNLGASNRAVFKLTEWAQSLRTAARSASHPFSADLMAEALAIAARKALTPVSSGPKNS